MKRIKYLLLILLFVLSIISLRGITKMLYPSHSYIPKIDAPKDTTLAFIVDGELSETPPSTEKYVTRLECNDPNAIGTITWNGSSWDIAISNITYGNTRCDVYFDSPSPKGWRSAPQGSLLAGIRANNQTSSETWTTPGDQINYSVPAVMVVEELSQREYYCTYADGYEIDPTTGAINLTGVHTDKFSSYQNFIGKYVMSNTVTGMCQANNVALNTNGVSKIYSVIAGSADRIHIKSDIMWIEVDSTYQNYYWTYGTGVEKDPSNSAKMQLTGVSTLEYSSNYSNLVGKYLVGVTASANANSSNTAKTTNNLSDVYIVKQAGSNYLIVEFARERVLAEEEDDYGISYYYRGAVENNFVSFAGMCWRIVRITGDGSIKLTLYNYNPTNGTNPCASSLDAPGNAYARYDNTANGQAGASLWNSITTDSYNSYIGYMYSNNPSAYTYEAGHANNNDSTILTNLKAWYDLVFSSSNKDKLADVIWCNDKRPAPTTFKPGGTSHYGTGIRYEDTFYEAGRRVVSSGDLEPSLSCGESISDNLLSKFTASTETDGGYGNGALNGYKIGLLTIDEVVFAGSTHLDDSIENYLYQNANYYDASSTDWAYIYWTMTPYRGGKSGSSSLNTMFVVNFRSGLNYVGQVNANYGRIRPAIALKRNTTISGGNGTQANPFVVN